MANKMTVNFDGMQRLQRQLDELGGESTKRAIEGALKSSQQVVARKTDAAMQPHIRTGKTKASIIKDGQVEWTGDTASINVGFDLQNGGMPSIYLMHGTTLHGQPHISPDKNLYDAVYGSATRKEIKKVQEKAFNEVLREVMKE